MLGLKGTNCSCNIKVPGSNLAPNIDGFEHKCNYFHIFDEASATDNNKVTTKIIGKVLI